MLTSLVCVEAKAGTEVVFEGRAKVEGYYQTLGVTASDENQLRTLIQEYLSADLQSDLVKISERWSPDFEGADRDIRDDVGDMDQIGIWYASGHAWFGPEEQ